MRVYETYTSTGWVSELDPVKVPPEEAPLRDMLLSFQFRGDAEIDVRLRSKANALVSAGEPLQANIPAMVELSAPVASNSGLPVAMLAPRVMVPPKQYTTLGSVSIATPAMLRNAERLYPPWVTDRHFQLPQDFPDRVKELAIDLTKDADNPYDKAEAIRQHLVSLPYSLEVVRPPQEMDWVEHFLFVHQKGYCQNYASAMITMLRSLGIPARLVVGFAPGVWDKGRGEWEVQAQHYHAWPEVYFTGHGWVEFEPTPSDVQPALEHLGIPPLGGALLGSLSSVHCIEEIGVEFFECVEEAGASIDVLVFDPEFVDEEEDLPEIDLSQGGDGGLTWQSILIGLGLLIAFSVPMGMAGYSWRGFYRFGYPTQAYARMCALGRLAGVGLRPQDTPSDYCARLAAALPGHEGAIADITGSFVTVRYGPNRWLSVEGMRRVRAVWPSVRWALLRLMVSRWIPGRR